MPSSTSPKTLVGPNSPGPGHCSGEATRRQGRHSRGRHGGVESAWRLSEPGWRDRFDSITVYQRGWRLGGKGASSRGANGRIEEHGLHIWLGSYENAFGLLREGHAELDRATTDPQLRSRHGTRRSFPATTSGWPTSWAAIG